MGPMVPFIAPIASVISAGVSFLGAKKEGKIGEANTLSTEAETAESARRLEDTQRANVSIAKARGAASGVRVTGSQSLFIETLKSKQAQELSFLKRSGASRAEIERKVGEAKEFAGFGKAFGSLLKAGGQFATI